MTASGSPVTALKCPLCEDSGWVCEEHPQEPWDGDHACGCGAPGMPCPECNAENGGNEPRFPSGFTKRFDNEGSQH